MEPDNLEELKTLADAMGVQYHPNIKADKLREKIANAKDAADNPEPVADVEAKPETENEKRLRIKKYCTELIRVQITCMNPLKKEWDGEFISVGNSVVNTIREYVPFNATGGWHLPRMVVDVLRDRKCQTFHSVKNSLGMMERKGKLSAEFAIIELPALTASELKELADSQALRRSID